MSTDRIDDTRGEAAALRAALVAWYRDHRRDLPWRRTRDPYAIWISEVMLQQTTVAAVVPYWQRFLSRFPDVGALAAAPLDEVLALWSGLGYYRRARHLHAAARALVAAGRNELPASLEALRALPGIGEYTAAAIGSIAFGIAEPVLDGNVVRVLARLDAESGDPARAATRRRLAARARALLAGGEPGEINQALMELGATVCSPRAPACGRCPWAAHCRARRDGRAEDLPRTAARPGTVAVVRAAALVRRRDGALLLARVPEGEPNAGLWEPPTVTVHHAGRDRRPAPARTGTIARRARDGWRRELGLALEVDAEPIARVRHAITRHRITVHLFAARASGPLPRRSALRWWDPAGEPPALTAAGRRLLARIGAR